MREIKFRGYCEKDSEWRYGFYASDGVIHEILTPLKSGELYGSQIDSESLGQYTGLKDENGVEIYEGDVLKVTSDIKTEIVNVFYFMGNACWRWGCNETGSPLWPNLISMSKEVIGNIYENAELLK